VKSIDTELEEVRAEALRKLGRNVVNFSKIEAVLKLLLTMSRVEGTAPTLSEQFHGNKARLRKQSLGRLVQEFHKILTDIPMPSEPDVKCAGFGVAYSVNFAFDPDFVKQQKRALSKIVTERNRLIHQDLIYLDGTSIENYQELIRVLDEQNPRLLRQLEELGWMMRLLQDTLLQSFESLRQHVDDGPVDSPDG
jgi:hypothetical protein